MARADVVYVHGLWLNGRESLVLRRRLEREIDCRVHPFRYRSVSVPMSQITAQLAEFVSTLDAPSLHFVGHSLGGLVIYRFFERFAPQKPGRVVFLGTPSVDSRAAAGAARLRWAAPIMGRCISEELAIHRERSWTAKQELGIVAGKRRVGLGQFVARFDEDSDGTVAVSETRLPGATDHAVLPVSHMGLLLSAQVARETAGFLESGRFSLAG